MYVFGLKNPSVLASLITQVGRLLILYMKSPRPPIDRFFENLLRDNFLFTLRAFARHLMREEVTADKFIHILISSSIKLSIPLVSFQLANAGKFFRNANLYWVNLVLLHRQTHLPLLLMDRRRTNQLLGLDCDIISITVAMLTGPCVMGRHGERMQLPFNDFCHSCRSAKKEKIVIHFYSQCPSLARCRNRLFGSLFLVSLTELSSVDIKDIASFIKMFA